MYKATVGGSTLSLTKTVSHTGTLGLTCSAEYWVWIQTPKFNALRMALTMGTQSIVLYNLQTAAAQTWFRVTNKFVVPVTTTSYTVRTAATES